MGKIKEAAMATTAFAKSEAENVPAPTYDNPWLQVAAESSGNFGKLLKFVKGKWEVGDDEVPIGTEYIAHIDQLARGWVHFEDGEIVGDPIIEKIVGTRGAVGQQSEEM